MRAGQQIADRVAHGRGTKQQRLAKSARMEQAIGEDVTALAVGGELNLVDGDEVRLEIERQQAEEDLKLKKEKTKQKKENQKNLTQN
jgi:hypothetical protein